jgi:hypothetical protein
MTLLQSVHIRLPSTGPTNIEGSIPVAASCTFAPQNLESACTRLSSLGKHPLLILGAHTQKCGAHDVVGGGGGRSGHRLRLQPCTATLARDRFACRASHLHRWGPLPTPLPPPPSCANRTHICNPKTPTQAVYTTPQPINVHCAPPKQYTCDHACSAPSPRQQIPCCSVSIGFFVPINHRHQLLEVALDTLPCVSHDSLKAQNSKIQIHILSRPHPHPHQPQGSTRS